MKRGLADLAAVREPYRLFFPLGMLMSFVGVGHWLVYGMGFSEQYSGSFHSSVQVWLYLGCYITGFLMTAVPRLAGAPLAAAWEVVLALVVFGGTSAALFGHRRLLAEGLLIVWVLCLAGFVVRRFRARTVAAPPSEFVWIGWAFLHALAGLGVSLSTHLGLLESGWWRLGRAASEQGFLISIVLGVGGFLGPRLLGSHELPSPEALRQIIRLRRSQRAPHLIAGAVLFVSFWLQGPYWAFFATVLRAGVVTWALTRARVLLVRPRTKGTFAAAVQVAFWMIAAGPWLAVFFPRHQVAALHVLFIGGFSVLTFAVSTMVVLSHAGEGQRLERFWAIPVVTGVALLSLAMRVLADGLPQHYFTLLSVGSMFWLLGGGLWLGSVGSCLFRALPDPDRSC